MYEIQSKSIETGSITRKLVKRKYKRIHAIVIIEKRISHRKRLNLTQSTVKTRFHYERKFRKMRVHTISP